MPEIIHVIDVFETAVRIEQNGIAFYGRMADKAESEPLRSLLNQLKSEEEKHLETFRRMLERHADYIPRIRYPGRYEAFLSDEAFVAVPALRQGGQSVPETVARALDIAIQGENQSIAFYEAVREDFSEDKHALIQAVIDQEKVHLKRLQEFA